MKSSKKPIGHSKTTVSKKEEVRYSCRLGLLFGSEALEELNLQELEGSSRTMRV